MAAVNRRALTVEWVDWLYALAFSKRPEGPYENQENGAGLLALLEFSGSADPTCSGLNRRYLGRNVRGWNTRFRNTDDALVYQSEWITNAFFQSLFTGLISKENQKRSFEWLLLQALPDGGRLGYNHPDREPFAGIAYWGARLLHDRKISVDCRIPPTPSIPGRIDRGPTGGRVPCNRNRNLSPGGIMPAFRRFRVAESAGAFRRRIKFRDGWSQDSKYLLLNLRFSGWHLYKASNTVTLLYQQGPVVMEDNFRRTSGWLPEGRSLFRDKRIPGKI